MGIDPETLKKKLDNSERPIFMKPGHCAGDLLEAERWNVLVEEPGRVELDVHLPEKVIKRIILLQAT